MRAAPKDGYWPAGELKEGDASTGKWQELTPSLSLNCAVFPNSGPKTQAVDGDYAWALWRPYSCCQRKADLPRQYRLPIRTRRRIMRMNITSVALTWLLAAQLAQADDPINVSKTGTVLSDEVLYSIGGGSAVSMGSAGQMDSIGVGFGWNNDLMCGNMNLSTTLENQLNGATQGFQNIMGSVIQNATGAVMSLPALIIQRANPQLYNLITNGILQARIDYDRSKGTCRAIAEKMADIAGSRPAGENRRRPGPGRHAGLWRERRRIRPRSSGEEGRQRWRNLGRWRQGRRLRPEAHSHRQRRDPGGLQPVDQPLGE